MISLGKHHLAERRKREQILGCVLVTVRMHWDAAVWTPTAAGGEEVPLQDLLGDRGYREMSHGVPELAIGVAVLQPPREHDVDRGPRDHS